MDGPDQPPADEDSIAPLRHRKLAVQGGLDGDAVGLNRTSEASKGLDEHSGLDQPLGGLNRTSEASKGF